MHDFKPIQDIQKQIRTEHNRQQKRKKDRERYYYRKAHGLCVHCGAKAAPGKVLCQACLEYQNAKNKPIHKQKYWERRDAGLCTQCGKPLAEDERQKGLAQCLGCRARRRVEHFLRERGKGQHGEEARSPAQGED